MSRILAENIELREQIIKLQLDLDSRPEIDLLDSLKPLQIQVQSKLVEIGDLVKELEKVHVKVEGRRAQGTSAVQRLQREEPVVPRVSKAKIFRLEPQSQDGRLPTIIEDKCFIRQSTGYERGIGVLYNAEANELRFNEPAQLQSSLSDEVASPVLGSPPKVSFEIPVDSEADAALNKDREEGVSMTESPPLKAFANLEVRKKRRDSAILVNAEGELLEHQQGKAKVSSEQSLTESMPSLKIGAKRKLTARDDARDKVYSDDSAISFQVQRRSGFTTNRENVRAMDENVDCEAIQKPRASVGDRTGSSREIQLKSRKALEPKCVNTDPVASPVKTKARDSGTNHPKDMLRPRKTREHDARSLQAETLGDDHKHRHRKVFATVTDTEQPSRPASSPTFATSEYLSPMSSGTSSAPAVSRDTPPPSDPSISGTTEDEKGSMGRSSRRAKGAISYVQPNLRDKMRRPTKELMDAVVVEGRSHFDEGNGARPVLDPGQNEADMRTVVINREVESCQGSREMIQDPLSPLRDKNSSDDTRNGAPRQGRKSVIHSGVEGEASRRVSPSTAGRLNIGSMEKETPKTPSAADYQDIFDFQSSSRPTDTSDTASSLAAKQSGRVSRRHSSMQMLQTKDLKTETDLSSMRRQSKEKKLGSLKGLRDALDYSVKDENKRMGSRIVPDKARAERIASRRRSMIL